MECVLIEYDLKAKAYWCYDRTTKKVYSTYHVWFIEHQDNNTTPELPKVPIQKDKNSDTPTIDTVIWGAVNQLFSLPDDDEDNTISNTFDHVDQPAPEQEQDTPVDPLPQNEDQADEPVLPQVWRSTRVLIFTVRSWPENPPETAVQQAVRKSREAGKCIREAKLECQQVINELHHNVPLDPQTIIDDPDLDQVLAALREMNNIPGIDASDIDSEVPKTWKDVQNSPDAEK